VEEFPTTFRTVTRSHSLEGSFRHFDNRISCSPFLVCLEVIERSLHHEGFKLPPPCKGGLTPVRSKEPKGERSVSYEQITGSSESFGFRRCGGGCVETCSYEREVSQPGAYEPRKASSPGDAILLGARGRNERNAIHGADRRRV